MEILKERRINRRELGRIKKGKILMKELVACHKCNKKVEYKTLTVVRVGYQCIHDNDSNEHTIKCGVVWQLQCEECRTRHVHQWWSPTNEVPWEYCHGCKTQRLKESKDA